MVSPSPFRASSLAEEPATTSHQCPYTPLPDEADGSPANPPSISRRPFRALVLVPCGLLLVAGLTLVALLAGPGSVPSGGSTALGSALEATSNRTSPCKIEPIIRPRGVAEGVSAKSFLSTAELPSFPWTVKMLAWQRTAFHFQPKMNWMNGPLFYKGWYHLFYQYNPDGAVWGNIVWGHAISRDLIHWRHLPIAMVADHWYDINGVWTGSATVLPDGQVVMLYTGSTNESVQVQNLAYPANLSDPLLVDWVKYSGNPVLVPPAGIHFKDFRDPTTAWSTSEGKWRITIGSKVNKTGISLVYETKDFISYELLDGLLHAVPGTGMWECVDFYPVSKLEENGLDTSVDGPGVKHVVKASLDDTKIDYYAVGTYDGASGIWTPDDPKGIPRTIIFDKKTGSNILQWPIEEVEKLRLNSDEFNQLEVRAGSVVSLDVSSGSQLDIMAEFEVDKEALERINGTDVDYKCSANGGAAERGALGPFGLLVLADKNLTEQTPLYFYIAKGTDGNLKTFFCTDQSRSSEATDVDKSIYGSTVPVLKSEKLHMRILVDHSIVESFAQGGRTCITSRVYPTKAIYGDARLFLFNNATETKITASLKIWQMSSAYVHS
ncbi:hypothetical protein RJ639_029758 [Escallonia herrerae]|uniref:beta-fructofuranosidase n=1 Tax=Escallonia herrerae TaxID=1293975 RepID=A0AA89BDY7_9ASTE|nr:hypothetical protein RJ639_029758 [Escallonia herrerae]